MLLDHGRKSDWPFRICMANASRDIEAELMSWAAEIVALRVVLFALTQQTSPRSSELLVAAFDRADQMAKTLVLRAGKNACPDTRQILLMIKQLRKSIPDGPNRRRRVVH
jgi:hypothetical protein